MQYRNGREAQVGEIVLWMGHMDVVSCSQPETGVLYYDRKGDLRIARLGDDDPEVSPYDCVALIDAEVAPDTTPLEWLCEQEEEQQVMSCTCAMQRAAACSSCPGPIREPVVFVTTDF